MANYLCAVSASYPENYQIGLRANTWGVREQYRSRIQCVRPGDRLVFLVGGAFRSVHSVEGAPFDDDTPLWPTDRGSVFPHRVRISDPLAAGALPVSEVVTLIGFMAGLHNWRGAVQGRNGVFNSRLTDDDMSLILDRLTGTKPRPVRTDAQRIRQVADRIREFQATHTDLRDQLYRFLPSLGLAVCEDGRGLETGTGTIDALCQDPQRAFVVVLMYRGRAPAEALLRVLRDISWVRQHRANGRDVRGIILTESAEESLTDVASEVGNVRVVFYRLGIQLADPAAC